MHKTLATKISIFLISILSCLFLFSCADPNNNGSSSSIENENKTNDVETPSYYAMIGTWINPDDNSDTITISEDTVTLSGSLAKKYFHQLEENPSDIKITEAKTVNNEYIQKMKDDIIQTEIEWNEPVITNIKKNETETYTWLEKIDIEYTNRLDYFQKEPSLFFGFFQYIYLWLDNEVLNVSYISDFNEELYPREFKYIKQGSGSQTNPSDNIDIIGSYTINEANGSTFTFAQNSTWTYQYNSRTSDGSWTFADGELTITYSFGGYSNTAVFTVSVSDDTYTLTGKSGDITTIIASAFKITDQNKLRYLVNTKFLQV